MMEMPKLIKEWRRVCVFCTILLIYWERVLTGSIRLDGKTGRSGPNDDASSALHIYLQPLSIIWDRRLYTILKCTVQILGQGHRNQLLQGFIPDVKRSPTEAII
jgi:hypothetical protein